MQIGQQISSIALINLRHCYRLSIPKLDDQLGNANVIGLERVEGYAEGDGADAESPFCGLAPAGYTVFGEVVDDAGSKWC
jgi:hypothetical protein